MLLAALLSGSLLLAGCGKYGKPVRQAPQDRDGEKRYTLVKPTRS